MYTFAPKDSHTGPQPELRRIAEGRWVPISQRPQVLNLQPGRGELNQDAVEIRRPGNKNPRAYARQEKSPWGSKNKHSNPWEIR